MLPEAASGGVGVGDFRVYYSGCGPQKRKCVVGLKKWRRGRHVSGGGVGRHRAASARAIRTCVFIRMRPAEAQVCREVGDLDGGSVGGLPSEWEASACLRRMLHAAVWARGDRGGLGGGGVADFPFVD